MTVEPLTAATLDADGLQALAEQAATRRTAAGRPPTPIPERLGEVMEGVPALTVGKVTVGGHA